jgi:hypothetical protein
MPANQFKVVSGAYNAVWNGNTVGQVQLGGFKHRYSYEERKIMFDAVGTNPVDTLYTGLSMYVDFVCMQYHEQAIQVMSWPFHTTRGTASAAGFSMWERARPLVLSACDQTINPRTITFYKTILAPNYEVAMDFSGVQERMVPIRLIVYPIQYEGSEVGLYSTPLLPAACVDTVYFSETLVP